MQDSTFLENGYKLIKGLINPNGLISHVQHLESLANQKRGVKDDPRAFYKDEVFEKLLTEMLPTIEEHTGLKLFKTYSYARSYEKGEVLRAHRDRKSCEVTVSITMSCHENPWPISLINRDEKFTSFLILPGDALMFKGVELIHWRERNIYGSCFQVLLHYVDQAGPYAAYKDDGKKNCE